MELNPTSDGNLIPNGQAFALLYSHGSMQFNQGLNPRFHQQGSQFHQDVLPCRSESMKENEKHNGRVKKKVTSDNNGINFEEQGGDGCYDGREGIREFLWQRVKWTEQMVKLLIDAVNYIEAGASSDYLGGVSESPSTLQKLGRWKCVSKLMVERGYHVSPRQCEHKFNELNKRYNRLNDVLGRGNSCKVVENPELLDVMNVSDKEKEEVKKILSSKNLFHEEMCSYHTENRLHLPHNPEVQRSLQLAIGSKDNNEPNQSRQHNGDDDFDKEQQDARADDQFKETDDHRGTPRFPELSSKRSKQMNEMNDVIVGNPLKIEEYGKKSGSAKQDDRVDMNHFYPNDSSANRLQEQWMAFRLLQLQKQKLQIQVQKLELGKQQFKWRRINWNKYMDLDKMRLENECMKLENECLAFELENKKRAV